MATLKTNTINTKATKATKPATKANKPAPKANKVASAAKAPKKAAVNTQPAVTATLPTNLIGGTWQAFMGLCYAMASGIATNTKGALLVITVPKGLAGCAAGKYAFFAANFTAPRGKSPCGKWLYGPSGTFAQSQFASLLMHAQAVKVSGTLLATPCTLADFLILGAPTGKVSTQTGVAIYTQKFNGKLSHFNGGAHMAHSTHVAYNKGKKTLCAPANTWQKCGGVQATWASYFSQGMQVCTHMVGGKNMVVGYTLV